MYAPYPENMMESVRKVEATRAERMKTEPRRLTAEEKDALLKEFHPDYNPDAFAQIKVGANKGQKALHQLLLQDLRLSDVHPAQSPGTHRPFLYPDKSVHFQHLQSYNFQ